MIIGSDIKQWLEGLTKDSHQWLNYFHAAYLNSAPKVTLQLSESKAAFWNKVNSYGTFIDGLFAFVTVDFFFVLSIYEWINCLASYVVQFFDCCNIKDDRRAAFLLMFGFDTRSGALLCQRLPTKEGD
jgi:hypothetical protein